MSSTTDGADRRTTLGDGTVVVEARRRALLGAWVLDTAVVWGVALGLGATAAATGDPGAAAAVTVTTLPIALLVYGFSTGRRRSLGQLATRTRTVRFKDGGRPGFFRAAWVMAVRLVLLPFTLLFIIIALFSGDTLDIGGPYHLTIDDPATDALR